MGCGASTSKGFSHPEAAACYAIFKSRFDQFSSGVCPLEVADSVHQVLMKITQSKKDPSPYISIVLDGRNLGDMGVIGIAEILKRNCKVRGLSILNDTVGELGATELGKVLRFNDTLESIVVTNSALTGRGVVGLIRFLLENETLAIMKLVNCDADDSAALVVSHLMLTDSKLTTIDLSGNAFGELGKEALVASLRGNYRVTSLSMENNTPQLSYTNEIDHCITRNQAVAEVIQTVLDKATDWESVRDHRLSNMKGPNGELVVTPTLRDMSVADTDDTSSKTSTTCVSCKKSGVPLGGLIAGRRFCFGSAEMLGRRQQMQDVVLMLTNFNGSKNQHLFGVFDGHGGLECARFVGSNFGAILLACIKKDGLDAAKNLKDTFAELDEKCRRFDMPHGTCAVVCFLVDDKIYTACVGDSRAVLARGGEGLLLSQIFKPTDPNEKERIKELGGFVTNNGRVGGVLAVSRALGDITFQPFVSPEPSIDVVDILPEDEFLIIACDGIWDMYTNQQSVDMLRDVGDARVAAGLLRDMAYLDGSADNISTIVVRFH